MEFPHELKELYPAEIIEVRGNAEALTIILKPSVDIDKFSGLLQRAYTNLDEPMYLFLKHEGQQDFRKITLS
ncbi:hypothetical protein ACJVDH_03875 [Pedobacter sp. AW1-32]|uniref:hypothetical protein n=1 Tax=Pedobacter sp. AW1-32 TaxID=3383026 RepID=UPI003FEED7F5